MGVLALAALAPAAMLTVDPWGWYPFGPSKWLVIPTLLLGGATLVLRDRPIRVPHAVAPGAGGPGRGGVGGGRAGAGSSVPRGSAPRSVGSGS